MRMLMLLFIVVEACGGMPPTPMCQNEGEGCTGSAPCCSGLTCSNAICAVHGPCGALLTSCGGVKTCCSGLICSNTVCKPSTPPPICGQAGATCSTMYNCCQGSTCPRYGTRCALGDIGDPCQQNADCLAGLYCNNWCTRSCTSQSDCNTIVDNPAGVNDCVGVTNGGFICFPFCTNASECSIYGTGLTCSPGNTPSGGTSTTVCG